MSPLSFWLLWYLKLLNTPENFLISRLPFHCHPNALFRMIPWIILLGFNPMSKIRPAKLILWEKIFLYRISFDRNFYLFFKHLYLYIQKNLKLKLNWELLYLQSQKSCKKVCTRSWIWVRAQSVTYLQADFTKIEDEDFLFKSMVSVMKTFLNFVLIKESQYFNKGTAAHTPLLNSRTSLFW